MYSVVFSVTVNWLVEVYTSQPLYLSTCKHSTKPTFLHKTRGGRGLVGFIWRVFVIVVVAVAAAAAVVVEVREIGTNNNTNIQTKTIKLNTGKSYSCVWGGRFGGWGVASPPITSPKPPSTPLPILFPLPPFIPHVVHTHTYT